MDDFTLQDTGERMIPEFHSGLLIYAEHLIRYRAVSEMVSGKVVLDIASGSGYGSAMLAESAAEVFGFDADPDAVRYATHRFGRENLTFAVGDATKIPLPDDSVDVAITFETIEHVADYETFVAELSRVTKSDGVVIVSTPNDLEFAEGNHFHLHEFERDELTALLRRSFTRIDEYYQATWKYVAINTLENLQTDMVRDAHTLNLSPVKLDEVLYFYFVCSNEAVPPPITPIAAVGEHYSDRILALERVNARIEVAALRDAVQSERDRADSAVRELGDTKATRSYRLASLLSRLWGLISFRRFKGSV